VEAALEVVEHLLLVQALQQQQGKQAALELRLLFLEFLQPMLVVGAAVDITHPMLEEAAVQVVVEMEALLLLLVLLELQILAVVVVQAVELLTHREVQVVLVS